MNNDQQINKLNKITKKKKEQRKVKISGLKMIWCIRRFPTGLVGGTYT
jgi:hypothetical protein